MATPITYDGYNLNPSPIAGQGAFGMVPGAISAPPSIWDQLNSNIPGYSNLTSTATGDIQSELSGQLSPQTLSQINDYAAARGESLGQPNSPLANLIGMNITGTTSEGLQNQGLSNLNTFTGTTGAQQQSPSLLTNIAETNAVNQSAPDPASAASYALSLYQQYMNPTGGKSSFSFNPAGGGGSYSQFPSQNNLMPGNQNTGGYFPSFTEYNTGGSGVDNVDFGG